MVGDRFNSHLVPSHPLSDRIWNPPLKPKIKWFIINVTGVGSPIRAESEAFCAMFGFLLPSWAALVVGGPLCDLKIHLEPENLMKVKWLMDDVIAFVPPVSAESEVGQFMPILLPGIALPCTSNILVRIHRSFQFFSKVVFNKLALRW